MGRALPGHCREECSLSRRSRRQIELRTKNRRFPRPGQRPSQNLGAVIRPPCRPQDDSQETIEHKISLSPSDGRPPRQTRERQATLVSPLTLEGDRGVQAAMSNRDEALVLAVLNGLDASFTPAIRDWMTGDHTTIQIPRPIWEG